MTRRERAILRHYFGCDNAKETARRFGISERQVRRIKDGWKRRAGCRNDYELARLVFRVRRHRDPESVPMWA